MNKTCENCRHDSRNNGLGYWTHDPCKYCSDFDEWEKVDNSVKRKINRGN